MNGFQLADTYKSASLATDAVGENHANTTVSDSTLLAVLTDLAHMTGTAVARKHGISPSTVSRIRRGERTSTPKEQRQIVQAGDPQLGIEKVHVDAYAKPSCWGRVRGVLKH